MLFGLKSQYYGTIFILRFTKGIMNIQLASLGFNGTQSIMDFFVAYFAFLAHREMGFNYVKSCIYFTENID